jgi:hypothetical protein
MRSSVEQHCSVSRANRHLHTKEVPVNNMKFALKLIAFAVLSFLIGIACASPLLVSELNIRPWITHVQGPTAKMDVEVVYANFSLLNANSPLNNDSGPTISYYAVVNVTNPSEFASSLTRIEFLAAQRVENNSGYIGSSSGGVGWEVAGVWLDGKWYNVTWVNVSTPSFESGNISVIHVLPGQEYWIEGVRLYDRYVNGILVATYLDMNGTWTDVSGKVTVNHPPIDNGVTATVIVADETHYFENIAVRNYPSNGTVVDPQPGWAVRTVYHLVGEGLFNNSWAPHQSRLILISGSWDLRKPFADIAPVLALQSGNLTLKTMASNFIDSEAGFSNNTVTDTWSDTTELKQVQLTQSENSLIYNPLSLNSNAFRVDTWGVEVNLRSDTP